MTDDDRALLEFEENHPRNDGRKEELARAMFGMSKARYFQRLLAVIEDPAAIAEYPMLVKRLQRRARAARGDRAARRRS